MTNDHVGERTIQLDTTLAGQIVVLECPVDKPLTECECAFQLEPGNYQAIRVIQGDISYIVIQADRPGVGPVYRGLPEPIWRENADFSDNRNMYVYKHILPSVALELIRQKQQVPEPVRITLSARIRIREYDRRMFRRTASTYPLNPTRDYDGLLLRQPGDVCYIMINDGTWKDDELYYAGLSLDEWQELGRLGRVEIVGSDNRMIVRMLVGRETKPELPPEREERWRRLERGFRDRSEPPATAASFDPSSNTLATIRAIAKEHGIANPATLGSRPYKRHKRKLLR